LLILLCAVIFSVWTSPEDCNVYKEWYVILSFKMFNFGLLQAMITHCFLCRIDA